MTFEFIIEELKSLIEEGNTKILPSSRVVGYNFPIEEVDENAYGIWFSKVITVCRLSTEIKNSIFYDRLSICSNNTLSNYNEVIGYIDAIIDFLSRGLLSSNNDISGHDDSADDPILFISHCSRDKQIGDALREFLIGLGVPNERIIYTSHPLNKIPLNKNIYEYLRDKLNHNFFMIVLWSNDYLESPACLNELGALWVTQSDYTNLYTPSFSFGNPKYHQCAIDTEKMGAVLNGDKYCKASLIELKNTIKELYKIDNNEQQDSYSLDRFIEQLVIMETEQNNGN